MTILNGKIHYFYGPYGHFQQLFVCLPEGNSEHPPETMV